MVNRKRVARFLDHLSVWVFGGYVECWQQITQEALDALIQEQAEAEEA